MTLNEFKQSQECEECIAKILNYRKGLVFTIPFYKMTKGQQNAMDYVLRLCEKYGYIESISIDYSIEMERTEETYRRV